MKTATKFTLPNQDDRSVSLKDFNGKWVILYFYPKDCTSGCTVEAQDFTAMLKDLSKINTVVLGVSPDSPESHRKFIHNYDLKVTLLSDVDKKVMKQYGAWGMKKNYGKEYEGVIRSTFLISPEGKIAESWSKVKVRVKSKDGETKHAEIVMDKIKELS